MMRKLLGLVASVHILCGLVLGWCASHRGAKIPALLFIALVFADSGLLGIGGVLAANSTWIWGAGVLAGLAYLATLSATVLRSDVGEFLLLILATFATVCG